LPNFDEFLFRNRFDWKELRRITKPDKQRKMLGLQGKIAPIIKQNNFQKNVKKLFSTTKHHSTSATTAAPVSSTTKVDETKMKHRHVIVKNREELNGSFESLVQAGGIRKIAMGSNEASMAKLSRRCLGANVYYLKLRLTDKSAKLSKAKVEQALRDLQYLHPPLRCRVTKHGRDYVMEENVETKFKVETRSREQGDNTFREIFRNELQREALQLGEDPHRVFILQNPNGGPQEIVLGFQHFCNDGTSTTHLVHEFMQLFSGLKTVTDLPPAKWDAPADVQFSRKLNPTGDWQEDVKLKLKVGYSMLQQTTWMLMARHSNLLRSKTGKNIKDKELPSKCISSNHVVTLSEEVTAALKHSCRKHHATFTTAVAEAFSRACGELIEIQRQDTQTPIKLVLTFVGDARQYVTPHMPERSLTPFVYNLLNATDPASYNNPSQPIWKLAKHFRHAMKEAQKTVDEKALVVDKFYDLLPSTSFNPTLGLSSWGSRLPFKRHYGSYEIDDVELFMNFNFLAFPMIEMYPADPETRKLRVSLFGTVPFFDESDLEKVTRRAEEILIDMSKA
jgi:hypothetical protein